MHQADCLLLAGALTALQVGCVEHTPFCLFAAYGPLDCSAGGLC